MTTKWWTGNNIGYLQLTTLGTVSLSQVLSSDLTNNTAYALTYSSAAANSLAGLPLEIVLSSTDTIRMLRRNCLARQKRPSTFRARAAHPALPRPYWHES